MAGLPDIYRKPFLQLYLEASAPPGAGRLKSPMIRRAAVLWRACVLFSRAYVAVTLTVDETRLRPGGCKTLLQIIWAHKRRHWDKWRKRHGQERYSGGF
jgi:hypothetical protein